jgi:hypothetical protein
MQEIHPAKQGLNPWIARKNSFVQKVQLLSERYHSQRGRNPIDLEMWEHLIDDEEVKKTLPVQTFLRIEEKINTFWIN